MRRTARVLYLIDVLQAAPYGPYPAGRAVLLTWVCEQLDQHPGDAGMRQIIDDYPTHLVSLGMLGDIQSASSPGEP
ncbi:hypothetical protein PMI22_00476 [Pseudomonas sp. GM21]|uniref:hypothetical protein n=1 Tax=Pseudomonas sp. GM21 TaxID=1144325 RepID=UPI000272289A|nr:hypothetical protein [Pseudomonas sp. GM21]EJM25130.1 hypothetical protein PMI22_00476 [Pseudomonas sp. GM21]